MVLECGGCREIEPEALARLVGWSITLKELAADALMKVTGLLSTRTSNLKVPASFDVGFSIT